MINKQLLFNIHKKKKKNMILEKSLPLKSGMVILEQPVQHFLARQGEGIVHREIAREKAGWKDRELETELAWRLEMLGRFSTPSICFLHSNVDGIKSHL